MSVIMQPAMAHNFRSGSVYRHESGAAGVADYVSGGRDVATDVDGLVFMSGGVK
jgi:hypothetical protein